MGYSSWGHKESDMTERLSMYLELKRERGRRRRGRKGTKKKKERLERRRKEGKKNTSERETPTLVNNGT